MSAILLIGNDVIKVSNLKYFKLSKDAIVLEKCSKDQLQDKYNYWYNTINYKNIKLNDLKYCFKNIKTGDVILETSGGIWLVKSILFTILI